MKKCTLIVLLVSLRLNLLIAQEVEWVSVIGGSLSNVWTQESGEHICFDTSGNVVLSAYFDGQTCDVDNGPFLVSSPNTLNSLAYKVDPNKVYVNHSEHVNSQLWHQNVLSNGSEYGCGVFFQNTQFGAFTLTGSPTAMSGFVYKKDAAGNFVWAQSFNGNSSAYVDVRASTTDTNQNIYIAGMFQGTVNFGTSVKTANVFSGGGAPGRRNFDGYVVKYDSTGNVVWVKTVRGPAEDRIESIKSDRNGNIYVTGCFEGGPNAPFWTDFFGGPTKNTTGSITSMDLFVAKIDQNGNVKWVRTGGGKYNDYGEAVEVDKNGNVYVGGDYSAWAEFDGQRIDSVHFSLNFLVNKYDSTGNLLWIRTGVGTGYDVARSISASEDGEFLHVTGVVSDKAIFGSDTLNGYGGEDVLLASYRSDGTLLRARAMGSSGNDRGHYVAIHPQSGEIFLTGYCNSGASFDNYTTTGHGGPDIFLAKFNTPNFVGISESSTSDLRWNIYPVPAQEVLYIQLTVDADYLVIYDGMGKIIKEEKIVSNKMHLNIGNIDQGMYYLEVVKKNQPILRTKFIKN